MNNFKVPVIGLIFVFSVGKRIFSNFQKQITHLDIQVAKGILEKTNK